MPFPVFFKEMKTKENTIVSCIFYPSLVLSRMLQAKGELGCMSAVSPRFFVETSFVAISVSPKDAYFDDMTMF